MNGNDHTDGPVELRPCPEHQAQQKQSNREGPFPENIVEIDFRDDWETENQPHCECSCSQNAAEVIGWRSHCIHVYANYSPKSNICISHPTAADPPLNLSRLYWQVWQSELRSGGNHANWQTS
jgi:hypothetical protein